MKRIAGKSGRVTVLSVVLMGLALVLSACGGGIGGGATSQVAGTLVISGSTALQPMVQQAAEKFMAQNPKAQITVNGGGSGTGLSQVAQGQVQIGMSDIFAEEKEGIDASQLIDHKVAVVGFAMVVNKEVTVDSLTASQVADIFAGNITNWKEVGGPDLPIVLVNRPASSGTRATFAKVILKGKQEAPSSLVQDSSGQIRKIVGETKGAISYLALSYVDSSIKALKLDGIEPTAQSILDGKYPFWSYEHMYTKGAPQGLAKAFLDYMMSDTVQANLVTAMGYIPVSKMVTK